MRHGPDEENTILALKSGKNKYFVKVKGDKNMEIMLFGDDNAMFDPLLLNCYVQPKEVSDKPILTGRWGIGKTASFFYSNSKLSEVLKTTGCDNTKLWFISEGALDTRSLAALQSGFGINREGFKRSLELLWKAEIMRTICILLSKLQGYYGCHTNKHWQLVSKAAKTASFVKSVWERLPNLAGLLLGKERKQEMATLAGVLGNRYCQDMFDAIQHCLRDVKEQKVQPIVVIEPLDTPLSGLEKGAIAQILITALLNVYYSTFAPSESQLIQIRISIPWHRYNPDELDFPQRFPEYVGYIRWNAECLKEFISRRIEWEFKRVNRHSSGRIGDAWNTLFEAYVLNDYCEPKIREDSFRYFLRHTHYRPRELQQLTRRTVEKQAAITHTSADEILRGRGGRKISASIIKETIREVSRETMRQSFIPEVRRKYGDDEVEVLMSLLSGISMPFKIDDIKKRYRRIRDTEAMPTRLNNIIMELWKSGIIGVEIIPILESNIPTLLEELPKETLCSYTTNIRNISRWYLFAHNWEGDIIQLLLRYENSEEATAGFVLHPRTFQDLLPRSHKICPIGI